MGKPSFLPEHGCAEGVGDLLSGQKPYNKAALIPSPEYGKEGGQYKRSTVPPLFVLSFRKRTSRTRRRKNSIPKVMSHRCHGRTRCILGSVFTECSDTRLSEGIRNTESPAVSHRPTVLCQDTLKQNKLSLSVSFGLLRLTCFRSLLYGSYYSRETPFCQELFHIFQKKSIFMYLLLIFPAACGTMQKNGRQTAVHPIRR